MAVRTIFLNCFASNEAMLLLPMVENQQNFAPASSFLSLIEPVLHLSWGGLPWTGNF